MLLYIYYIYIWFFGWSKKIKNITRVEREKVLSENEEADTTLCEISNNLIINKESIVSSLYYSWSTCSSLLAGASAAANGGASGLVYVLKLESTKWPSPSTLLRVSHTTLVSFKNPWSVTSWNISSWKLTLQKILYVVQWKWRVLSSL